ncbi:hypothetical protein AeRB84_016633 [Aphanomyces euteiches]|nr:hypothetical protein AeRB84_016633 [Aphanomyces euteiches]
MDRESEAVWSVAFPMIRRRDNASGTNQRRFVALFGVNCRVATQAWRAMDTRPVGCQHRPMLWALLFLKVYASENVYAAIAAVDEKNFRKWSWIMLEALSSLNVIQWSNRLHQAAPGVRLFVSLDGTDFAIQEPQPFNRKWWSHKLNRAALRYEVGICIRTGYIVWVNGDKPAGEWPDLRLARDAYVLAVQNDEMTLADKGYMDRRFLVNPNYYPRSARAQKKIMERHETANAWLKQFGVLKYVFRHRLEDHLTCFLSVANLVQISIECRSPLYDIDI